MQEMLQQYEPNSCRRASRQHSVTMPRPDHSLAPTTKGVPPVRLGQHAHPSAHTCTAAGITRAALLTHRIMAHTVLRAQGIQHQQPAALGPNAAVLSQQRWCKANIIQHQKHPVLASLKLQASTPVLCKRPMPLYPRSSKPAPQYIANGPRWYTPDRIYHRPQPHAAEPLQLKTTTQESSNSTDGMCIQSSKQHHSTSTPYNHNVASNAQHPQLTMHPIALAAWAL
jgi:hypothetical protein